MRTFLPRLMAGSCILGFALSGPVVAQTTPQASPQTQTVAAEEASVKPAAEAYSLADLQRLALKNSLALQSIRDQVDVVRATVTTAKALPNPQIEYLKGPAKARDGAPVTGVGDTQTSNIIQPIDLPNRRWARIGTAEAGLAAAEAAGRGFQADVITALRIRFYELLRREAELKAAREDANLIAAIRSRIATRVAVGEVPRFELIKADTESLNAQKAVMAAKVRVEQARAEVRQLVGRVLPADFTIKGRLDEIPEPPSQEEIRQSILDNNPELKQAQAVLRQAESRLDYAQSLRWPELAIKAGRDEQADLRTNRLGVVMTIPLWDWKAGPVAEARAGLSKARHDLTQRLFTLEQAIHLAYHRLEMARTHVMALENGIIRQAAEALKVAESAYRFGERGFIDVLDAQRVHRAARNELITARYEFAVTSSEIERLRALPIETAHLLEMP